MYFYYCTWLVALCTLPCYVHYVLYAQQRSALMHNVYTIYYMCGGVWDPQVNITIQVPQDVGLAGTTATVVHFPA